MQIRNISYLNSNINSTSNNKILNKKKPAFTAYRFQGDSTEYTYWFVNRIKGLMKKSNYLDEIQNDLNSFKNKLMEENKAVFSSKVDMYTVNRHYDIRKQDTEKVKEHLINNHSYQDIGNYEHDKPEGIYSSGEDFVNRRSATNLSSEFPGSWRIGEI